MSKYELVIYWSDADNAFVVEVPELPGCMADGLTYQEAVANAERIIAEWLEIAKGEGRDIPEPTERLIRLVDGARNVNIAKIGIIGGSGLYQMPELEDVEEVAVDTPFGSPSDSFIVGTLDNNRVAFLPRHGRGHRFTPTEVPFRANIYAMKLLGVERILSASAVGSLQEEFAPLDMVIPDQFFDRTRARARESTFFGEGIVAHVAFAHPVCDELGDVLEEACKVTDVKTHRRGTYICMEGPAFSTKAESEVYRSWGMSVIGMTNLQEAKLAREAEICYATLALVTDYDCWHPGHDAVTADLVFEYLNKNVRNAQLIMKDAVRRISEQERACKCGSALKNAIFTAPQLWPEETRKKLDAIVKKYAQM